MAQNIVVSLFKVESEAYQALTQLKQYPGDEKSYVSAAALVKKENGSLSILDAFDTGTNTADDMAVGGLVGAQRTETMEGIFGIRHLSAGKIKIHGKEVSIKRPKDAMDAGIGMITEDRRGNGIFGCLSIKDNVGVSVYNKYLRNGIVLDHPKINKVVDDSIKKLSIKTPSMQEHISNLSGGNQQKVIVSRWLANDPDILIMDEPTRGIDVGAKHEIYEIMEELAEQGKAIIMISSEMPELLGMADRVCVMCNGKLTGEISDPAEMTQEKVMSYATMF